MTYSEYPTRLPLDRWAEIAGIHPLHLSQLRTPAAFAGLRPVGCDDVIYQHRYQSSDGVPGRNDIARAIFEAERDMEQYLHFPMIRTWIENEPLPVEQLRHPMSVAKVANAHVLGLGVRTTTLIAGDAAIARTDEDGDTFKETVTVTASIDSATADAVLDAEEFRLFYPGKGTDPVWEIRPVTAVMDPLALTVTITARITQFVKPSLYEQMVPEPLDPDDSATYFDTVDVYRVYSDTTVGNAFKVLCGGLPSTDVPTGGFIVRPEDVAGGIFRIVRPWWGVVNAPCFSCIDPVETLSYVAGYPKSTFTRMEHAFERAVVALSLSRLGGICHCSGIHDYSRDLSIITQATSTPQGGTNHTRWALKPPDDVMKNPFGTSEGENIAWTTIVTEIAGETANDYFDPAEHRGHRLWRTSMGSRPLW